MHIKTSSTWGVLPRGPSIIALCAMQSGFLMTPRLFYLQKNVFVLCFWMFSDEIWVIKTIAGEQTDRLAICLINDVFFFPVAITDMWFHWNHRYSGILWLSFRIFFAIDRLLAIKRLGLFHALTVVSLSPKRSMIFHSKIACQTLQNNRYFVKAAATFIRLDVCKAIYPCEYCDKNMFVLILLSVDLVEW